MYKGWNRELTLKCKLKCYLKPMKDPLGDNLSKGNQGTTRGKEKNSFDLGGNRTHDLWIRSTVTLPTELRGRTEKVWTTKVVNRGEEKVRVHMNVVPRSTTCTKHCYSNLGTVRHWYSNSGTIYAKRLSRRY